MGKFQDLTGQRFGRLVVVKRVENNKRGQTKWLCFCDCGNKVEVLSGSLKNGNTKSCGCLSKEKKIQRLKIHGLRNTRIYRLWIGIKERCYNQQVYNYNLYGGRGITVCKEWKDNFQAFYSWAINNGYNDSLTIDRIDVNGNYEPSNCRWATVREQANNRRSNHFLTFNNETHTLSEWSRLMNVNWGTLLTRIRRGWSVERAFTTPVNKRKAI